MTVYSSPDKENEARIWVRYTGNPITLCFFADGEVKVASAKKCYPLSMKMIDNIGYHYFGDRILRAWMGESARQHPIYRDVLRDYLRDSEAIRCNLPLDGAKNHSSYQHWIQGHYKTCGDVPKSVNKMPLRIAVEKALSCRHIKKEEQQKIYGLDCSRLRKYDDILHFYYRELLQQEVQMGDRLLMYNEKQGILTDYISMSKALKLPINLGFRSFRKVMDAHNALITPYMLKVRKKAGTRRMVIPKDSPFRKLKLPDEWELIKTGKRLYEEGMRMYHCVYDYLPQINKDKCCICHMEHNGAPYTLQIIVSRKKFVCVQIQGRFNIPAPEETWGYVNDYLKTLQLNQDV